jgi:hypothetical protein
MPKATLLLHRKRYYDDGGIAELRLWLLESPVPGSAHRFKYGLFHGYPGRRVVACDNERGNGDHRHLDGVEAPYSFQSVDRLLADFAADVARMRQEEARDAE